MPPLSNPDREDLNVNMSKSCMGSGAPSANINNTSPETVADVHSLTRFSAGPSQVTTQRRFPPENIRSKKESDDRGMITTCPHSPSSDEKKPSVEKDSTPQVHCTQTSSNGKVLRKRKTQKPGLTARGKKRQFVSHNYVDRAHEFDDVLGPEAEALYEARQFMDINGQRATSTSSPHVIIDPNVEQTTTSKKRHIPFPFKLHIMLYQVEKNDLQDIISWLPHGRAFAIHSIEKFKTIVMGKYFQQSKVTSFHRQLNLYGFVRITVGNDQGGYYNEYFLRGKPSAAERIVRTKVKGTKIRAASSPEDEPNFYLMEPVNPPNYPAPSTDSQRRSHKDESVEDRRSKSSESGRQKQKKKHMNRSRNGKSVKRMAPEIHVHRVVDLDKGISCQDETRESFSYLSSKDQSVDTAQVHSNPNPFNHPMPSSSILIEPDTNQDMNKLKRYAHDVPHTSYYDAKIDGYFSNQNYYRHHYCSNFTHAPTRMLVHDNVTNEKHSVHNYQQYIESGESSCHNGNLSPPLPYKPYPSSVAKYPLVTEQHHQHNLQHPKTDGRCALGPFCQSLSLTPLPISTQQDASSNRQHPKTNGHFPIGQFSQSSSLTPLPISAYQEASSPMVSKPFSNSQLQKFDNRESCDPILDDMVNNMNWGKPPPHYAKDAAARSDVLIDKFDNWDADGDSLVGDDMNRVDQNVSNKKAKSNMSPSSDEEHQHMDWTIELLLRL